MKPAYPIACRDEIVETQGRLFGRFQCENPNADGQDFITAYMRGETRARIDNAAAVDPFAADWIGQFYAYYQWQTGERSRDIVSRFPTQVMCAAYPGLHDLDLSLAAERMAGQVLH